MIKELNATQEGWRAEVELYVGINAEFIFQAGPAYMKRLGEYEGLIMFFASFLGCDCVFCPFSHIVKMTDESKCVLFGSVEPPPERSPLDDEIPDSSDTPF